MFENELSEELLSHAEKIDKDVSPAERVHTTSSAKKVYSTTTVAAGNNNNCTANHNCNDKVNTSCAINIEATHTHKYEFERLAPNSSEKDGSMCDLRDRRKRHFCQWNWSHTGIALCVTYNVCIVGLLLLAFITFRK